MEVNINLIKYFYLKYLLLDNETVCKVLRNFTIPILRKIEITIDFNGHTGQFSSFSYSEMEH